MKELFVNDFVSHYHISSPDLVADEYELVDNPVELKDSEGSPLAKIGDGQLRMHNVDGGINAFAYDRFISSCKKPQSFQRGRKRCDWILTSRDTNQLVCLVEFTSSLGNIGNLSKPISDGSTSFAGGKMEKAEIQLSESLETMMAVPTIATKFNAASHRVCLTAYRISPITNPVVRMRYPDQRYKLIEARETGDKGAIISMPSIEQQGFEYRRVAYPTLLKL